MDPHSKRADSLLDPGPEQLPKPPEGPLIPEGSLDSAVQLNIKNYLCKTDLEEVQVLRRAANYISAAMIFLNDNILLKEKLSHDHVKSHRVKNWGTFPGLVTLVYAHLNRIVRKKKVNALYVVRTGYGPSTLSSCMWLEDSLEMLFPEYKRDHDGLKDLIKHFGGFPGRVNEETTNEGKKSGNILGVSIAAILNETDLIVACIIGDGEAGTGPTDELWQGFKLIDPAACGAVLPILHVNDSKSPEQKTHFGTMDDKEIVSIFTGYGFQVRIVQGLSDIDNDLAASMNWAYSEIESFQYNARFRKSDVKPRWPMLVLRTPIVGLSCPKKIHGEYVEGPFHSCQVPFPAAKTLEDDLQGLEDWLSSYNPRELFSEYGALLSVLPEAKSKKLRWRILL